MPTSRKLLIDYEKAVKTLREDVLDICKRGFELAYSAEEMKFYLFVDRENRLPPILKDLTIKQQQLLTIELLDDLSATALKRISYKGITYYTLKAVR